MRAQPPVAHEREHERRRARAGGGARLAQPAADELVDERAQVQVGVERCHGSGSRWPPTSSCSTASPRPGGAGSRYGTRSRHATGRSRPTCPATASSPSAGPPRSPPATPTCARSRTHPITLAGYSMGGRIALHAALSLGERVERLVLIGASPGLADPAERAARARRRRGARRPDRGDRAGGVRARVERPAAVRRHAARDRRGRGGRPHAQHRGGARRRAARPRHRRRCRRSGTASASCAMPVELVVGERDEKFRAIAERMEAALA